MSTPRRVVLVDDEEDLREPVVEYLVAEGLDAVGADGGAALDRLMSEGSVAAVVLDVNMPGENGFSIARRLRAANAALGIVMLTSKRDLVDKVVGLELGADDYLVKPFEPRELLARLRALLRRAVEVAPPPTGETAPDPGYDGDFWVQGPHGLVRVHVDSVEWIEAAKDYVLLHTQGRSHLLRHTMSALEKRLDPERMLRVHRSAFVRPDAVAEVKRAGRTVTLVLTNGSAVQVGPAYVPALEARLGL